MATNQLERIADLVERVSPLGGKSRGMPIEADDWNTLVDVVLGLLQVGRAQAETTLVTLQERFAPREHEHLGDVTDAWLDPALQARVGAGGGGSVPTRTALAELESRLGGLGTEVARLTSLVSDQRRQLDRSAVTELDRTHVLKQFDDRFAGVENLRTQVATLATDVGGVKTNVTTLLDLRRSLSDPLGNPIDVARMRQDLTEVQALRENLQGVDGSLLRLRDVELKLREVSDAVGTSGPGGLDARITGAVADAERRLDTGAVARSEALKQSLTADAQASEARLRAQLDGGIVSTRIVLGQSMTDAVAAAETRLTTTLNTKITQTAATLRTDTLAATGTLIDQRLAGVPDQVRSITTGLVATLRTDVRDELRTTLRADLDGRFATLNTQVNDRLAAADARQRTLEAAVPGLVQTQVTALGTTLAAQQSQALDTRLAAMQTSLNAAVDTRARAEVAAGLATLDARIATSVDGRLADLDARVGRSVTAATRTLSTDISTEVRTQVTALDVAGQVRDSTATLAAQLRAEQARSSAEVLAKSSSNLSDAVTLLRSETAALRTEVNRTIDTRINANNTALRQDLQTDLTQFEGRLKPDSFRSNVVVRTDRTVDRSVVVDRSTVIDR
jgi:regulator of replication initiation timing